MTRRPTKEPIRRPWIWIVLALLMLTAIPWYLPPGSIGFVWLGLPAWMLISVVATLAMCGYVSWLCFTQWDVVEAEEEHARTAVRPGDGAVRAADGNSAVHTTGGGDETHAADGSAGIHTADDAPADDPGRRPPAGS